ncbi:kinase-like domain-containing protein [Xylariaceae sp. AK1471]|nr:kinase-like domain-containing protein [Xylariaceae sp. AK1471]
MYNNFMSYRERFRPFDSPTLPLSGEPPELFTTDMDQMAYPFVRVAKDKIDIDAVPDPSILPAKVAYAWSNAQELKKYFARERPGLRYRKCLGWGGNGLAAAFDVLDKSGRKKRSVVVKMLFDDEEELMDIETENSDTGRLPPIMVVEHRKAEHIVQLEYIEGEGLVDNDNARSPKELSIPKHKSLITFVTEMLENGDLAHFLCMVQEHRETIPNEVLWRFFLCFVRMCIGLAFPPGTLQENEKIPGPITETVPDRLKNEPRRIVHFDFDPRNIFVGDVGVGAEHNLTPLLKLGDFGLTQEVLYEKDDFYYERFRYYGKRGFFAPEQFCVDWDYIPMDSDTIFSHHIAGNYGAHTNVWAIGYVMECLITLCYPAQPPKPTKIFHMPPKHKRGYYTYGAHLGQDIYSHIDPDIISIIMRCQAHLPVDRPALHELEKYVTTKIAEKSNSGKTDQEIMAWIQKVLYEPPIDPPTDLDLAYAPVPVLGASVGSVDSMPNIQLLTPEKRTPEKRTPERKVLEKKVPEKKILEKKDPDKKDLEKKAPGAARRDRVPFQGRFRFRYRRGDGRDSYHRRSTRIRGSNCP